MRAPNSSLKPVVHVEDTTASRQCPARGKQCLQCRKFNHFARACRSKPHTQKRTRLREVHTVLEGNKDFHSELFIDTVAAAEHEDSAYADIELRPSNIKVTFKLDTGAQENIIPTKIFQKLMHHTPLDKDNQRLCDYGGHQLRVRGYCELESRFKDRVVKEKRCCGLQWPTYIRLQSMSSPWTDHSSVRNHSCGQERVPQPANGHLV